MDNKELEKLYSKLLNRRKKIQDNELYASGKNPYILRKSQEKKPDNRVPSPLAKMAIEDMAGYAGRAGDIQVEYELADKETKDDNDQFIEYMRNMDAYNNEDLETAELYSEMLEQGESFELWWVSDALELGGGLLTAEYKIVPNMEMLLIYDNSIKKNLVKAIHFTEDEEVKTANIYYPLYFETWEKKDSQDWTQIEPIDEEGNPIPQMYPYEQVPVIHFKGNRRCWPLFEAEKPLIDAHDELISKSVNEVDRFNAAITLLGDAVDTEFVQKLKEGLISVIDDLNNSDSNNWPTYLEKNLGGISEFYNQLTDRIERLYHKSIKVPDMSDENFAGNQSGVALAFKLTGMEFKASQIETYFNTGLKKRMELYGDVYNASSNSVDIGEYESNIRSKRNLPVDIEAKARIAQMLTGLLTEETLLKFLPKELVDDAAKEMERKREETPDIDLIGGDDDTGANATDSQEQN